jgi:RND superfamily putative drug exporter
VYRYRYIVIGLMVALCVGGGIYGMDLGKHVTQSGFYDEGSQSVQASLLADGAYGRDRTSHVVAILTPPGDTKVDDPQWSQRTVEELDAFVAKHDDKVAGWAGWLRAPDSTDATVAQMKTQDMRQTFVSIPLEGDNDDEILKNYQDVAPDLKQINDGDIKLAGLNPLASELTGTIGVDQQRAEIAAIPLVAVLLFFVFGGVVAASLPAIIGGLTILGALGIMRLVADFAPVHFFAQPVVTLIGLGIAIDYGLFIVSRFREEIAEGYDTEAAVRRTVMTAGRTVVFSAVIIVASSLPLLLFPQGFLKSITYAIIASVMLAAVLSITVLAAILAILGPNVDALGVRTLLRVPFLRNWSVSRNIIDWVADKTQKTKTREEVESGFWGKLVNRVMKRPILFAAPIVVLMIVMIIPLGNLALGGISEKYLPPDNQVRVAQEEFDRTFPGFRTEPLTLVISNDDGQPVTDQQVAEIRSRAMAISGFTDPDNNPDAMWKPRPGTSNDPSVRVIQNGLINRNDAAEKIEELREISPPRGVSVYVGGTPALEQDSIHSLYSRLPLMVLLLISTTTILMFLAFGSLVLPIKAALMSALTLGSTMGILTWMFVDGHGSGLMNYTPQPLMAPMIGLIIAVIYGLSTDYEVFLVSRMVEARDRGMSTTESIRVGTATTGRLITAAALVLAVVAGAFVFSDLVMMKYLAFGLLIALLLDATIVRMFLVPAIMKLLGDDCWWAPKWMKRLQHKIGLGETTLPDELKRPVVRQPAGALVSAVAAPAHPVGGPGASTDDAPTTRFGTAKSPEGKSPEGKSSEGRDIGSWLSEIRGKVLPRSDRVEPSIAGEPTSVIADPAPVEEPPTTAIPTQSTSLSAEETRAIPVSRPISGDSDVATEQLNARAKSNGVSAQDLLRREGRL